MTKPRLLLADDSVTIRKVVELTFAEEGIEVISVADGDAAMQKFVEQTPDIVLVDVEMPGQNGYKICEMIKQDETTRKIPVLLLVGSFEPFDQAEATRVQADGHLMKPFNSIRDLVVKVSSLLANASFGTTITPDTEDIEELYSNSFAETLPFHDGATEEDLLLDDEMVETVRLSEPHRANGDGTATALQESFEETIEDLDLTSSPVAEEKPSPSPEPSVAETGFEIRFSPEPDPTVEPQRSVPFPDHLDPAIHDSKADTEEIYLLDIASSSPAAAPAVQNISIEPKEELIEMIANRVVEKLSDRVIREVAQDAVPRIAEKLIREALKEEEKG